MDDNEWLGHIFASLPADKSTPDFAEIADAIPRAEALQLITRIFLNCGTWLAPFTDQQVADGLVFIGAAGESDWIFSVYDPAIDWSIRRDCIRSINTLFRDGFARRCADAALEALPKGPHPLSDVCFMWWDRFPSGGFGDTERAALNAEMIDVMGGILQIEHTACQQSALHGLGHWCSGNEDRAAAIIDQWLSSRAHLSPELRQYAEAAKTGNVR